jgi:hypothetical protein
VVLTFCVDNDRDDNTSSYRYRKYHKPYFVRAGEGEWQVPELVLVSEAPASVLAQGAQKIT